MSDQKISDDPTAAALVGGEYLAGVQSAANVKVLPSQVLTYVLANLHSVNNQTGTTYTYLTGDRGKLVTHSNAAAIAGTLPQATSTFGASWFMLVQNRGAGTLTITPTSSTIDGASTLALTAGNGAFIISDGTNYYTVKSTSATAAGSSNYVQYNVSGSLGAEAAFAYDPATNTLTVDNVTTAGRIVTAASATGGSGFRLPHGAAPTSPVDGDVWTTSAGGLYARINGVTVGPFAAGGGSGTVTSVAASGGVQTTTGSAITSTGTVQGAHVINAQTGTTYALVATDRGKHVTISNAASIAVTIAQGGTTGFEDGYFTIVESIGAGAVTITPTTSTINAAATLVLQSGSAAIVFSDGTNYRAIVFDRAGVVVNAQTGTSYTVLSGDRGKAVTTTNGSAIAETLPQATGAFGAGWFYYSQNRGAGTKTITPTTSTIDGAASLALTTGQGVLIASDGTNYFTVRGVSGSGGLTGITETQATTGTNSSVNMEVLTVTGGTTDVGLVLKTKGQGPILAQVPDGTTAGGNARSTNSFDMQTLRSNTNQVASGSGSALLGTYNSRATGSNSVGIGGGAHAVTGTEAGAFAGDGHIISGSYAAAVGGISTTIAAQGAACVGGNLNVLPSSSDYSFVGGGQYANTLGLNSIQAFSSGFISAAGDSQWVRFQHNITTSNATPTALASNGTQAGAPSATRGMVLPNTQGASFRILVTARDTSGNVAGYELKGVIKRGANAAATAIVGTVTATTLAADSALSTASVTVVANTTLGSLEIQATGIAATTIHWGASGELQLNI